MFSGGLINIGWDRPASELVTPGADLWIADIAKSHRMLGFIPRVTLEEGLARTARAIAEDTMKRALIRHIPGGNPARRAARIRSTGS
jgi:hypothetical protein